MSPSGPASELIRTLAPQVLGILIRRHGQFDACEDAVQEAVLAAAAQWQVDGLPDNPKAWLLTVANRRLIDQLRTDAARERREETAAAMAAATDHAVVAGPEIGRPGDADDTLMLLFLCCHPALTPASQVALTLRAVGGLTTAQIARAFLVPEATMGPRISRAKQKIRAAGATFRMPSDAEAADRLEVVLHVLYLIFNEGYAASSGPHVHRAELTGEAIRLTREIHRMLPENGEVAGLLALMLLTDAHRGARTGQDGGLIPLAEQDRGLWDPAAISEGVELISRTLVGSALGPYQLQAAIAAVHADARTAADTDWRQILGLYDLLQHFSASPMIRLNRAIAVAMVSGPRAGLAIVDTLDRDARMATNHRLRAVRAHLLEMAGDLDTARQFYRLAARGTTSIPEQRHLEAHAARLTAPEAPHPT